MQGEAVHHHGHAELAHPVVNVVAAFVHRLGADFLAALPHGEVGRSEVGRTADKFGDQRGECLNGILRGFARGNDFGLVDDGLQGLGRIRGVVGGEFAVHAAGEFGSEFRMRGAVGGEQFVPFSLALGPGIAGAPGGAHVGGNLEGFAAHADLRAGGGDFVLAKRGTVHVVRPRLVRRTLADHRLAADQRRFVGLCLGLGDGLVDRVDVVAINVTDDVPAVGFKTLRRIVGEPAADVAVDGDAVVVVKGDQLVELPYPGQRADFVRDPFHHAAVTEEGVAVVVNNGEAFAVEFGGQQFFSEGKADGVADALPERASGRFHTGGMADFRMARRLAVQLAEFFEFFQRQVVAGEVQQRVNQHRAVAVGEHETVAISPFRIDGVVFQVTVPQGDGDFGHAHRGARMPGVGGLDAVHGQDADGVGQ